MLSFLRAARASSIASTVALAASACGAVADDPPPCHPRSIGAGATSPPVGSFALAGATFEGNPGDPDGWNAIGFDLDGKCTTSQSTDVCTLTPGAAHAYQADGNDGIDNAFGKNVAPIGDTLARDFWKDAMITITTNEAGSSHLTVVSSDFRFDVPLLRARIVTGATGQGELGAIVPVQAFLGPLQRSGFDVQGGCDARALGAVSEIIAQAADLRTDGTNPPGLPCDAISLGMTFTAITPSEGPPPRSGACSVEAR